MDGEFRSGKEFRTVIDQVFSMMSEDTDMGPKLRDADVPQRFEFTDVDLVVNIRAARPGEDGNLYWEWSDDVDWEPKVKMSMSSETANRYFQGKENVAIALRGGGSSRAAMVPRRSASSLITKPIYARYRVPPAASICT